MKHPDQQEWVAYLYRELDSNNRSRLNAHLAGCETCRAQLEQWQRVQQRLNAWELPQPSVRPPIVAAFPRLMRWAGAALLMIGFGFALGHFSGRSAEAVDALRDELRSELAEMVEWQIGESTRATLAAAQEQSTAVLSELLEVYRAERLADNQAIATTLAGLEAARAADFLSLRKDLETVAVHSDDGLRQAREQLVRLADYKRADSLSPPN